MIGRQTKEFTVSAGPEVPHEESQLVFTKTKESPQANWPTYSWWKGTGSASSYDPAVQVENVPDKSEPDDFEHAAECKYVKDKLAFECADSTQEIKVSKETCRSQKAKRVSDITK